MPVVVEAWNYLAIIGPEGLINWPLMIEQVVRAPFTEGLLVTGMIATTFAPTVVHLAFGFYGLRFAFRPDFGPLLSTLAKSEPSMGEAQAAAAAIVRLRWNWALAVPFAVAVAAFFAWLMLIAFEAVGGSLPELAYGSVELIFGVDYSPR